MVTVFFKRGIDNYTIYLYTFCFLLFIVVSLVYIKQCVELSTTTSKTVIQNITKKVMEINVQDSIGSTLMKVPDENNEISGRENNTYKIVRETNEITSNLMYLLSVFFFLVFVVAQRVSLEEDKVLE